MSEPIPKLPQTASVLRAARPWKRRPALPYASCFEALRGMDLFASLSDEALRRLMTRGRERRQDGRKTLLPRREPGGPYLLVLLEGEALWFWSGNGGKEALIGSLEPGDFIGHLELFSDAAAGTTSVRAVSDVRWMLWEKDVLLQALRAWPELAHGLLEGTARQQARLHRRLAGVCRGRAPRRLASTLADLFDERGVRLKDAHGNRCLLLRDPPPRKLLGEMAGLARETVSRLLSQWEQCGWLSEAEGDLVVRDEAQLKRLETG